MDYSRIRDFINSYSHDDEGLLDDIYKMAVSDGVPIIRKDTKDLLKVLIRMHRPESVLEIGTAVGYSTIFIADTIRSNHDIFSDGLSHDKWHIDTCELDEDRIRVATDNIKASGYEEYIDILRGDAAETLKSLDNIYDMVFIDAAKAQYMTYLEESMRLVHSGSVIVTDNILADGDVLESHFLVDKRDRTIHDRMREYIYTIKNDKRLDTAILSVGDGVAVSVVK